MRGGGRLVLLGPEPTEIHQEIGCTIVEAGGRVEPAQPLAAGLRAIESPGRHALELTRPAAVLFRRGSAPWLAEIPLGAGAVVVAPDAEFILNDRIARADHAAITEGFLAAGRRAVGFAEYARGIARGAHIGAVLGRFRLGPLLLWAALLFALVVWRAAPSFRTPACGTGGPPREAAEFLFGAAHLYERALPDIALIDKALAALRRGIADRSGLAGTALDAEVERALAEVSWTDADRRGPIAAAILRLEPCFRRIDHDGSERRRSRGRA
ncbi:MAG: hypothetical protein JXP34_19620 [Planctomycetes bacterium]|nr:hypothetical protein [Planctomycetota bacterium]